MADQLNIAIFGAGRMGRIHAETVLRHPRARLAGIVEPNAESAEKLAIELSCNVLTSDAVFADSGIDAIIIASVASSHPEIILRGADNRKAIFCEKPIAREMIEVRKAVARLEETGAPFLLGFNRRFDPSFSALKTRVFDPGFGVPELVILTSRDPSPPPLDYIKACGGLIRETSIHDIDVARWLTGEDPISVHAIGAARSDPAIAEAGHLDTVLITLKMPSGALVSINNSWRSAYGYDQRAEVHGAGGMLQVGNIPPTTLVRSGADGVTGDKPLAFFLERYADAYRLEMDYFIRQVLAGEPIEPGAYAGLRALEIAEAAERSVTSGEVEYLR